MVPQSVEDYLQQEEASKDLQPWSPPVWLKNDSIYCIKVYLTSLIFINAHFVYLKKLFQGQSIPTKATDPIFPRGIAKTFTGKWFNWYDDWPPQYKIPRYCNGNCNMMSKRHFFAFNDFSHSSKVYILIIVAKTSIVI